MSNHLRGALYPKSTERVFLAAIICGALVIMSGCKIPGLRRAQRGPAMPQSYNWNNGATFWNPPTASEDLEAANVRGDSESSDDDDFELNKQDGGANDESDDDASESDEVEAAQLNRPNDRKRFANFIKSASFINLNKSDEETDALEDKVDAMDDDLDVPNDETDVLDDNIDEAASDLTDSLIGRDFGPIDGDFGTATLENSAQLPQNVFLNDPYLIGLINEALVGNQELKILAEEIQIARNETYARSGEYRPFVTTGAGAGIEKPGRHTRSGAVEEQLEVAPGRGFPDPLPDFLVAANVSWELDIWKKLRNSQCAAAMRYLGTQEGRNYIVTRLVAEVAENYYELLALDNRLTVLDATIEIQQQSLQVAKAKKEAGRGTELAVQRFQAEVQKNQSERSIIEQEIIEVENRINFLIGRYPQSVARIAVEYIDLNLNTLSAGVPSQLLQNRADIRQAERHVQATGLDVQVARARFYPSLTLTGGLGWNAFSTGYLFRTPESLIYGMAGELVGPLINKRAIKADYCSANAAQLQSIYNYQKTVLNAHIEVVNQISKVENFRSSIEVKKQQLKSLETSVDVASKLFQNASRVRRSAACPA